MAISSFSIKDCGPIKLAVCDEVPNLMIIAGPNGAGKSTLLQALFSTLKKKSQLRCIVNVDSTKDLEVLYFQPHRGHPIKALLQLVDERLLKEDVLGLLGSPSIDLRLPVTPINFGVFAGHEEIRGRESTDVLVYFMTKITLIRYELYLSEYILKEFKQKGKVSKDEIPDIFKPFRDFLKEVLNLELINISTKDFKVYFRNAMGELIEFDELSSGEKDAIALIFPLIRLIKIQKTLLNIYNKLPKNILVLIDGIEEYLHPALQEKVINYIRKLLNEAKGLNVKVIMTTHSEVVFSIAHADELYVLLPRNIIKDGENQLVKVAERPEVLDTLIDLLGFPALTSGKPILLVEGKDDYNIIKKWFPDIENYLTLVPIGGKPAVYNLVEAIETLNKLSPQSPILRRIELYAIIDRDLASEHNQIVKYGDKVQIHVLPVTCIENLLIKDFKALLKVIEDLVDEKIREKYNLFDEESVRDFLSRIVMKDGEIIRHEINRRLGYRINEITKRLRELAREVAECDSKTECERIINTCNEVLRKAKELHKEIEKEVREISSDLDRAISEFNGKFILGRIAHYLQIKANTLKLALASKQRDMQRIPNEIKEFLLKIMKRN